MTDLRKSRPGAMIALALTSVVLGAGLGALTNSINGWISPTYFRQVMRWHDIDDIWRACIAQGIFEGLMFGLLFSIIFVIVVGVVTRARSTYLLSTTYLLLTGIASVGCWVLGGLIGMGLAALSPEFFQHAFHGVPEQFPDMIRYAWVGGSIHGIEFGGFASIIVASVLFRARWRTLIEDQQSAT